MKLKGDGGHSAATLLPCLATLGHLTANKRFRHASPKLPSATSFIRRTINSIADFNLGGSVIDDYK